MPLPMQVNINNHLGISIVLSGNRWSQVFDFEMMLRPSLLLCISHVGQAHLAVRCMGFESVTICNRLIVFFQ